MRELTIEITDKCSLNCKHCSTMAGKDKNTFMLVEEIDEYLQKYHKFDLIRFSGGEPFEHPNFLQILKNTKNLGKIVQVLSCGVKNFRSLPEDLLKQSKLYIDEIIFSLHGPEEIHDKIVTSSEFINFHPPYWDHVIDSYDLTTLTNIKSSFQTVLTTENYHFLEQMAKEFGYFGKPIHWHILRLVQQGRAKDRSDLYIEPDLEKISKDLMSRYNLIITYTNAFSKKKCDCGSEKMAITCYGEIISCSALKYGNKSKGKFACLRSSSD